MFVALVTTQVVNHQRRRKTAFFFFIVLAAILSFTGFLLLPGQMFDVAMIGIEDVFAGLALAAICAIAAIVTESRP